MQRPLLFLLACNLVAALPLHLSAFVDQKSLLLLDPNHLTYPSTRHLDRIPESAELLFIISDDDEMVHVWLPLGRRVSTRDYPVLPLHPISARIVNVLGSSTRTTARGKHQQVTCIIMTRVDKLGPDSQTNVETVFQDGDGEVRLNEVGSPFYLKEKEVESFECF